MRNMPESIKQLAAIAREKNHDYDLFLMDEPMSLLDRMAHNEMIAMMKGIVKELETTVIMTLNDIDDVFIFSDYTAIMVQGRLIQFGETLDVYRNPSHPDAMSAMSRLGVNRMPISGCARVP